MAPAERVRLPLRWAFVPVEHPDDRSILWEWRAFEHGGNMADAKAHGHGAEGA